MRAHLSKWIFTIGLLAFAPPAPAAPLPPFAPPAAGHITIYRGANLIDGTGNPLRPDMAVVVDGDTIVRVVPSRALAIAALKGADVVDLKGEYLLPGLVDSHEHLATPPDRKLAEAMMRRDLYAGITAVRDMADDLRAVGELTRQSLLGEIAGPDIYYAALMAGPSFFDDPRTHAATMGAEAGKVPWMQAIDENTNVPLAVAMARGTYATGIKIYANLPADLVRAITAEAHRQGILVWAHAMVFPATPADVIGAGVDVVSHVCYLAYQASDRRPASYQGRFPVDYAKFAHGDNPAMTALFAEMRRRGTILDATDRVYAESDRRTAAHPGGKPPYCTAVLAERLTNQAWRQGVTISSGTDGFADRADPYPALYEELALLAEKAGIPPAQVIRSATLVGATTIGQQAQMGTIAPGKLANMLVVAKNPLKDIRNLRSVVFTVKRGRRFDRSDYRPVTADEMPDED